MTDQTEQVGGSITREGDFVVIRIPVSQVQDFRVALQECPCKSNKTTAGIQKRKSLVKGLGAALFNRGKRR